MNWTNKRPASHGLYLVCFDGLKMKAVDVFCSNNEWLVIDDDEGELAETALMSAFWNDVLWLGPLPQPIASDEESAA